MQVFGKAKRFLYTFISDFYFLVKVNLASVCFIGNTDYIISVCQ
jgi:hypothetical protein